MKDEATIAESGLFDVDWYVLNNPESFAFPRGPLAHYIAHGASAGRAAGPRFDTSAYLAANPDVKASGINPLVHYIQHGAAERRTFGSGMSRVRRPVGRGDSDPVSFSLICVDGSPSEMAATFRSLSALSGADFELVVGTAGARVAGTIDLSRCRGPNQSGLSVRLIPSEDSNAYLRAAIEAASKDYIIVLDAGDVVVESALGKLASFIAERACDVVYSDERQVRNGLLADDVALKPGWSPDLLTAYNYFGRLTAIRRSIALQAVLTPLPASAAEWELNLGVAELTGGIEHLPAVLCRRSRPTARDCRLPEQDSEAHVAVLRSYWLRKGRDAQIARALDGTFRATWPLLKRPLVSIIIPNKDRSHLLRACTEGLYDKTAYDNFELIIVDNGSAEVETLALYDELRGRAARIISFDEPFNYSRACNLGAAEARGAFLLFLNNDIEVVQPNWLDELVRQASEPGVGVVGPKLLYPDGEIQHAGVALGLFTLAAHVFHRSAAEHWGPFGTPNTTRNWVAVTGACQLMRREVFDLVNGYDETFLISYSDVVLCMHIVRAGFRTVYLPSAVLVHHEGASRGHTNPPADQVFFAKRVRSLGFASDPFFHPNLDAQSFTPKLLKDVVPTAGLSPMQLDIDRLAGTAPGALDIFDDGAVATAARIPWNRAIWKFDPSAMQPDVEAGARILLEFIRRRRDLRARFPMAFRDGAQGGFAMWVKTEGLRLLGLTPDFAAAVDGAFEADLGAVAKQALAFNEALREKVPLLLLPSGAKEACQALFSASSDGFVTLESIWWFLVENAEDAQAALCETWAVTPGWQEAMPDGGTVFGVVALAEWVANEYGCTDHGIFAQTYPTIMSDAAQVRVAYAARQEWRTRFPDAMTDETSARALLDHLTTRASGLHFLPRLWVSDRLAGRLAHDVVQPGVNILGHFAYPSGLRISVEGLARGLSLNGVAQSLRDVPVAWSTDEAIAHRFRGIEIYDTTILHVQPEPLFTKAYSASGLRPRENRTYRIGLWYWEFDEVPTSWNRMALQCDEIWAATEFVADALRKRYRQPIHVLNPGVEISSFDRLPRSTFGLGDEFVFVFVFHMTSVMDRKNPLGLMKAFNEAFSNEPTARLVIKTAFGDEHPDSLAALRKGAEGANITIIDQNFSRRETLSLIAAGDAYISLHRSEGFGLTMAEAMLLGRPVVATRFSGNLDFMDEENSLLVDFSLVELQSDIPPYEAGLRWAEPSVADAARQMRRLFYDRPFARDLGENAKRALEARLNYRAAGRAIANRLAAISQGS